MSNTQITGSIGTLKTIIDTLARRADVRLDTIVTISQESIDASERNLRTADLNHDGFDPSTSIGFRIEPH